VSIVEKRRSDRTSVLSNDSLEDIRARLLQSPRKSLRKLSQHIGTLIKLGLLIVLLPHGLRDFWITLYKRNNFQVLSNNGLSEYLF
jgi:hypothetical protein